MRYQALVTVLAIISIPTPTHAEQFTQDLTLGSTGTEVAFLQEVLCQAPGVFPDCAINGSYGAETVDAVVRFQYQVGFRNPNGSVDSETRLWLNALIEDGTAADFNAQAVQMLNTRDTVGLAGCLPGRMAAMQRLFVLNPRKAREFTMPNTLWHRVPKTMRYMVERDRMHAKGTVVEHIEEQTAPPYATIAHKYIQTSKGMLFHVTNSDERLPTGTTSYARGLQLGDMLLPGTDINDVRVLGSQSPAPTAPAVAHLQVILLEFPDLAPNVSRDTVAAAMNAIPPFYQASSGGKTTVDLRVSASWHHSAKSFVDLRCEYFGMFNEAMALADAEFDFTQATTIMFIYPGFHESFTCPHGGAGGAFTGPITVDTPDGRTTVGVATVTDGIAIENLRPRTQIHEFSHTLGLSHAHSVLCPKRSFESDPVGAGCTNAIDPFDVMGCCFANDFNPIAKEQLGWLDAQSEINVSAPGVSSPSADTAC